MTANALHNIAQIETSLWEAADQLRANSNLTATEYSMPVLGVIFCGMPPTVIRPRFKPLRPHDEKMCVITLGWVSTFEGMSCANQGAARRQALRARRVFCWLEEWFSSAMGNKRCWLKCWTTGTTTPSPNR